MKAILVDAREDGGFDARLAAAQKVRDVFEGHLTCLQATPYDAFVLGDPFGCVYTLPTIIEEIRAAESSHRKKGEALLAAGPSAWTWEQEDGQPADRLLQHSRLADLVVLSLPGGEKAPLTAMADIAEVALHARAPVLAVPCGERSFDPFGTALVAWNGSAEAAHALRLTRPLLEKAGAVHVVTLGKAEGGWPPVKAAAYLARYGIAAELRGRSDEDGDVATALLNEAAASSAAYIVMGAYGHSRFREMMLGGGTRAMLEKSEIPLLLAH